MSLLWEYAMCAYIGVGVGLSYGATKRSCRALADRGTPGEIATTGIITFIVGALAWPFFFRKVA